MLKHDKNMGMIDRIIRITGGATLVYIGFFDTSIIANSVANLLLGVIGVANIFFSGIAYCPLYSIADFDTRHEKLESNEPE